MERRLGIMQSVEPVLENAIKTLQKVVDVRGMGKKWAPTAIWAPTINVKFWRELPWNYVDSIALSRQWFIFKIHFKNLRILVITLTFIHLFILTIEQTREKESTPNAIDSSVASSFHFSPKISLYRNLIILIHKK